MFHAWWADERERSWAAFADDAVFHTLEAGTLRGVAAMRQYVASRVARRVGARAIRMLALLDSVVIEATAEMPRGGLRERFPVAWVLRVRDGKIREVRAYRSWSAAHEAAGLTPSIEPTAERELGLGAGWVFSVARRLRAHRAIPSRVNEAWLIRHAETEWSRAKRHTGRTDIPLTDEGRAARPRPGPTGSPAGAFAAVWTSPLSRRPRDVRARRPRAPAPMRRDELLEWDYGDYEGITTRRDPPAAPRLVPWRDGCPGGESPASVGRPLRPPDRRPARHRRATSPCSPTATACGCSPPAGCDLPHRTAAAASP